MSEHDTDATLVREGLGRQPGCPLENCHACNALKGELTLRACFPTQAAVEAWRRAREGEAEVARLREELAGERQAHGIMQNVAGVTADALTGERAAHEATKAELTKTEALWEEERNVADASARAIEAAEARVAELEHELEYHSRPALDQARGLLDAWQRNWSTADGHSSQLYHDSLDWLRANPGSSEGGQ